ncbi:sugar phosphate nucleotidyltransferase [Aneurinibacillus sp. Ricciae_BoGa-3]|uniref:sugar phosphate nucleotidyltransferase n=1 Tax=Aneurinibacillus sp. Ricciae_BoGa-3 TaxID=3022697 RepID=UPI0023414C31|nr:sugar phosphate nucleotidyltransferase [Aneurinibacillus sp. Ricciae_BoGa-3]WCK56182.1 sugar phosphate nucleotidyltransferase [Aneurinibacillus sp. Ricciae_BoGa-3]
MKLVLLSGGSGKRLWPISNDARSKQFLRVLQNNNNERESMVQRVWRQLTSVDLAQYAIIATSKSQVDMIQSQLGHTVPLSIEPERRDTFPAIALSAVYLHSIQGVSLQETLVVLPVDSYVEDNFFENVKKLEKVVMCSNADLALIGVNPTFPSEKYGYIVPQKEKKNMDFLSVSHFQEKPTQLMAEELIKQGAFWNCGIFAFKLEKIISFLVERGLPTQYHELIKQYNKLPNISFDHEVVEKCTKIVVLPYNSYWKDLGTWNTLTEEMGTKIMGKGILSRDCGNTHIVNELDIPVAVLGLSDIVVAASPDGILVTDKNESPRVKEVVQFDQRPMYEERRWGWYRVLDYTKFDNGNEVLTKRIRVKAGRNLSYQLHFKRSEVWTIISGEGEFVLNDKLSKVKAGDVLQIPRGAKHGIKANTDIEFIEVQSGSELIESDIVRIYMIWEELLNHI